MTVRNKFIAVIVLINVVIATAAVLILPHVKADGGAVPELRGRANRISMSMVMVRSLSEAAYQAELARRIVVAGGNPNAAVSQVEQQLDSVITQLSFVADADREPIADLREGLQSDIHAINLLLSAPLTPETATRLSAMVFDLNHKAEQKLAKLVEAENSEALSGAVGVIDKTQLQLRIVLLSVAATFAVSLLLSVLAYRQVIQPLGEVTGSLNAVLNGFAPKLRLKPTRDEFGDIVRAIHKLQAQSEHIRRVAFEDPGTSLPNRNRLDAELHEVRRLRPIDGSHGLILIGVDTYDSLRSGFGLRIAESVMRATAERLRGLDRMPTTLFRVEPQTLGILVDRGPAELVTRADLKRVTAEAFQRMSSPIELDQQRYLPSVTAGAAIYPDDARDPDEYVNVALEALRHARASGPASLHFGERGHTHRQRKHLALADQIRMGLRDGQFVPYFQPIVDARHHKVVGAEVLVRWRQPDGRVVLPAEFIEIAESSETIREMTRSVLTQACNSIRGWAGRGFDITVAFNVSAKLLTPHILQICRDALSSSGLPASKLVAEVTETALVGNLDHASEILDSLRESGIRLCLDDFGTGYSSLTHLYRFQIDRIKIDPVVTRAGASNDRAAEIIRSMAELAERMNMAIIAEGVESEADSTRLSDLGCAIQQGFLYSRAMPPEKFIEWARNFEARKVAA